jgi:hypothetical protein
VFLFTMLAKFFKKLGAAYINSVVGLTNRLAAHRTAPSDWLAVQIFGNNEFRMR